MEKARANGPITINPATAALLGPELLLNTAAATSENSLVQSDSSAVKNEPLIIERPNNAGDHDDYTIAPKRMKAEPPT